MVEKDQVELHYCNTKINLVDIFTKGVVKAQYVMLRDSMVSPLCIKGENVDNLVSNSNQLGLSCQLWEKPIVFRPASTAGQPAL